MAILFIAVVCAGPSALIAADMGANVVAMATVIAISGLGIFLYAVSPAGQKRLTDRALTSSIMVVAVMRLIGDIFIDCFILDMMTGSIALTVVSATPVDEIGLPNGELTDFLTTVIVTMVQGVFVLMSFAIVTVGVYRTQKARIIRLTEKSHFCRSCGYDIRSTQHRCPECGAVPLSEQMAFIESMAAKVIDTSDN